MRYTGSRAGRRALPHLSAAQYQGEAYEKAWEDAAQGRGLPAWAGTPGIEDLVESPEGRVPKQNPDRTISTEGRFYHRCLGSKPELR